MEDYSRNKKPELRGIRWKKTWARGVQFGDSRSKGGTSIKKDEEERGS